MSRSLMRVAAAAALILAAAPRPASAQLNGGFFWPATGAGWPAARWSQELDAMAGVGMDIVITAYSVNETAAVYPTAIGGFTASADDIPE